MISFSSLGSAGGDVSPEDLVQLGEFQGVGGLGELAQDAGGLVDAELVLGEDFWGLGKVGRFAGLYVLEGRAIPGSVVAGVAAGAVD